MKALTKSAASAYSAPCCEVVLLENETEILEASAPGNLEDFNYRELF